MPANRMKAKEMKQKSVKELEIMLEEKNQELMNLRFQKAVSRLEKPAQFRELKKDRARLLTVMKEKVGR